MSGALFELVDLVAEMRLAQRTYFKTRDKSVLMRSKSLEQLVDAALAGLRIEEAPVAGCDLFGGVA